MPAMLTASAANRADFDAWYGARGGASLLAVPVTVATYLPAMAATHVRAALRRWVAPISCVAA